MRKARLGPIGEVSRLALGGGGLGGVWGATSRDEAIATIRAAVEAGIDVLDAAPGYRAYEEIIGETFGGLPPAHVRFTSKCARLAAAGRGLSAPSRLARGKPKDHEARAARCVPPA